MIGALYGSGVMSESPSPRYTVAIHRTSRGCFARVTNLPGCIAHGANEVEALENVRSSIRAYEAIARLLADRRAGVSLEISA